MAPCVEVPLTGSSIFAFPAFRVLRLRMRVFSKIKVLTIMKGETQY